MGEPVVTDALIEHFGIGDYERLLELLGVGDDLLVDERPDGREHVALKFGEVGGLRESRHGNCPYEGEGPSVRPDALLPLYPDRRYISISGSPESSSHTTVASPPRHSTGKIGE